MATANRRVSFAPEATLHTWDVVELPEDSTTSSASGNSTRRASALSAMATSPFSQAHSALPHLDASEPPSTPPEQAKDVQVAASPADQRNLHQKKRRRSSGIPPMNFNNPEDYSSSPYSGSSMNSDADGSPAFITADTEVDSSDSDGKDVVEDESTVTGIDNDSGTAHSALSAHSNYSSSTGSSGRLDEALLQAAIQAGTRVFDYEENSDITMEMVDDEVTNAFKPWLKGGNPPQNISKLSALQDQENVNPFSPAFKKKLLQYINQDEAGETMDLTQAAGTILSGNSATVRYPTQDRPKSTTSSKRRSIGTRRRSSGASSAFGDETMELTTVVGGIQENHETEEEMPSNLQEVDNGNEDSSMDLDSVMGGVLDKEPDDPTISPLVQTSDRRESGGSLADEDQMDMTFAAGGILPSITERTEPPEDQTLEMDITRAIGAILPDQPGLLDKSNGKIIMEREADTGQLSALHYENLSPAKPAIQTPGDQWAAARNSTTVTSESGSPSLAGVRSYLNGKRISAGSRKSTTPKLASRQSTPSKETMTPSKQLTPTIKPTTPGKTPPSKGISMRTGSPRKLFRAEIKNARVSPKTELHDSTLRLQLADKVGKPNIVLKPQRRRSSGLGTDKECLGSPRVTELLERRTSIGESAQMFAFSGQEASHVRFEDPRAMARELEQERADDERRESGRGILQMEANMPDAEEERDATANLKGMIESLTPQKKKLRGRKSLHVGAAKGLLGKRPAELDAGESDDESTPKRLKGREGSPVKKVKLPAPPPKNETTGRSTRSARLSLAETSGNAKMSTPSSGASPQRTGAKTPNEQPRFKDASTNSSSTKPMASFEDRLASKKPTSLEPPETEDRIHLQDFLNMTNIRFMELNTTKRRLTAAPNNSESSAKKKTVDVEGKTESEGENDLENWVVAGACTIPMLELYQHVSIRGQFGLHFC